MTENTHTSRLLILTTLLNLSGPALQAILLTAKLRDAGYDTCLMTGTKGSADDSFTAVAAHYGVEPVLIPTLSRSLNPLRFILNLWRLYQAIRAFAPDVVHTHNTTAGFLGRLAARLAGVPVVVHTLHMYPFGGYYNRLTTFWFIWLERIGAYWSDSIITLSEQLRRVLTEEYGITRKQRIIVLPAGYDLANFANTKRHKNNFRAAWHIPEDVPLVGIIGRLLPVKNHALFLEAAALVHAEMPQARFVIVGDGQLRQMLVQQAKHAGLADHVIFTGWQKDVADIYSDLDMLVICSLNEGTPVPIIEALAAGCPVVATDVGGVADLLDRGTFGTIVPSGDNQQLASGILQTLRQPYAAEPARAAMLNRYSIERLVIDLDSLYQGLLAKKRRR